MSYYRRFIKGFADIAKVLHKLTEKSAKFLWTNECDIAFQSLKAALMTQPILSYPDMSKPFILDTDASGTTLGAVLSQVHKDGEHVVAYFSKCLSKHERQYCITRKELLAVVESVKHFHHYLFGTEFLVRTDHGALSWLRRFKNPEGQLARWIQVLDTYNFKIQHRPGKQHGNADGLSRRPCQNCKFCTSREDKTMCFLSDDLSTAETLTCDSCSEKGNNTVNVLRLS